MYLLPPKIIDFLGESHQAVVLNEFLSNLDTMALELSYKNDKGGSSAYHPVMLLAVLVYGYMNGVFSSRQLAKSMRQDLALMYLSGNAQPDFRTLSRFRKEKGKYLKNLFTVVVLKAQQLGLVNFGTCCLDGTKIYASASAGKNKNKKMIAKRIGSLIKEAERLDQLEDELYGDKEDNDDELLKTRAGREQRRKEIESAMKKEESNMAKLELVPALTDDKKVSLTDTDSRMMQMKHGDFANGYNVQNITENGIILSISIFNSSADQATLVPSVAKLQETFTTPKILLADKGYSTENNYSFCEANNIDIYIPIHKEAKDLSSYIYNEESGSYSDELGRRYCFKQRMGKRDGQHMGKEAQ